MANAAPDTETDLWADGGLTIPEAVRFSGIGRTSLYDLMGAGRLPYSQPAGRRRLVPKRALVELLAVGAVGPGR
jgi:excisionase family DNA binding protein